MTKRAKDRLTKQVSNLNKKEGSGDLIVQSSTGISISDLHTIIEMLRGTDVASLRLTKGSDTLEINRFTFPTERGETSQAMTTESHLHSVSTAKDFEIPQFALQRSEVAKMARPVEYLSSVSETSATAQSSATPPESLKSGLVEVKSPMVGIFYRRPSPDEEPFVEVGSKVEEGDSLAIIEAMKVMNQVKSPVSGIVEEILPENGAMVEFGEILFRIKPI